MAEYQLLKKTLTFASFNFLSLNDTDSNSSWEVSEEGLWLVRLESGA